MDGINQIPTPSIPFGPTPNPNAAPAKVAKQFEGMFASMLIKQMRQTMDGESMFGQDSGDVLGGMFDQFIKAHLADKESLGIGEMVPSQLERGPADRREWPTPRFPAAV